MALTYRLAGQENDGATATPSLAKSTLTGLANGETVVVGVNHTGIATANAPTAPFTLVGELVAPSTAESSLHVYVGQSANWAAEAANFDFPISASRGGCIIEWVIGTGDVADLAAVVSTFLRTTSATPSVSATSTRNGALGVAFTGGKPASGTITGTAGGTGGTWTERADLAVSATSVLHTQTLDQTSAGAATAQPTMSTSASYAQAIVFLQPPAPPSDTTPPTVTSRTPASGAVDQAITTDVTATFSEAMDPATLTTSTFTLTPSGGAPVAATVTMQSGNTVARLVPSVSLAYGTTYTAALTSGAKDVAGNSLAPTSWGFVTVAAPVAPGALLTYGAGYDQSRWAIEVTDRSGNGLGALEPAGFRITVRLNGTADLQAEFLADDPGAAALEVYSRVIKAWRRPPNSPSGLYAARNCVFAGHVHQLEDAADADGAETVGVTARDPSAAFLARYHPWNSSWGAPGSLVELQTAVLGLISDSNISAEDPLGLDATWPHGLTGVAIGSGWPVGIYEFSKHQPVAEAFRQLQEGEAGAIGFYWVVKPNPNPSTTIGSMWVAVAAASLPTVPDPGVSVPTLEYGADTRGNVTSFRVERIPPINSVIAIGKEGLSWKNDSESSAATYGLWPVMVSYPDVETTARLDALARGVWQVFPTDSISVELAWPPDPDVPGNLPMLWDHFDVGSTVPVYLRGRRRTITGNCMVREATVEVDAEGTERLVSLVLDLPSTS